MYAAYCRIFERCGLDYLAVEAESGPIGGDASHEFMVLADNGEDTVLHCKDCGYAANQEKAEIGCRDLVPADVPKQPLQTVPTPGAATIEQVTKFLKCPAQQMIKTLIYVADGKPMAVLLRGDHEANEGKVRRAAGAAKVELADPAVIQQVTGAPVGFAGPVGLKQPIPIYADREIEKIVNGITGANQAETHLTGVNYGRDFQVAGFADLRNAVDGDPCPRCSSKLAVRHAIEVGHVFKLGTKYSDALSARFLDQSEQLKSIIMGCYGIGVNRIIAALIETCHDANGIIWPMTLAPYEVLLSPVKVTDPATKEATERLYDELTAAGIEVLVGRSRRSRRREVQGRRPDRHSAPRGDRRARPEGGQAGDEVAVGQAGRDDRPGRRRPDDRRPGDRRAEREPAVPRAVIWECGNLSAAFPLPRSGCFRVLRAGVILHGNCATMADRRSS